MRSPSDEKRNAKRASVPGVVSPRDALIAIMTISGKTEYLEFERIICKEHVKQRKDRPTYEIDKRNAFLGHAGRVTLRNPDAKDWPSCGATTSDKKVAEKWARDHYIPQLWQSRIAAQARPDGGSLTVFRAIASYLDAFGATLAYAEPGASRNGPEQVQSRVSSLRCHVEPALGHLIFATVTRSLVRTAAENFMVTKKGPNGTRIMVPAARGTRLNFVTALQAVWNHHFPDQAAPFSGVRLRDPSANDNYDNTPNRVYDLDNIEDDLRKEGGKSAMTQAEFELALVGGLHYDITQMLRPCIAKGQMIPNTVHLFAALAATGVRISEARRIRWCDINFEKGYIVIHSSKRTTRRGKQKPKLRIVPLQEDHVPWLRRLQREQGITQTRGNATYLFRTARNKSPLEMGAQTTLIGRSGKALAHAGVKPAAKATHWGRSTYATFGKAAAGVKAEELQHFLGHVAYKGSTDEYVAMLVELLRPAHRRIISLPSPEEVQKRLVDFVPAETIPWKQRRKVHSRARAAVEQRALDKAGARNK